MAVLTASIAASPNPRGGMGTRVMNSPAVSLIAADLRAAHVYQGDLGIRCQCFHPRA